MVATGQVCHVKFGYLDVSIIVFVLCLKTSELS